MSALTSLLAEVGSRISGGKNKKSFNLLYKGIDKVSVEEFHVNCDAKGPTVTILYGKHNILFGGYTSQDWSSNKKRTKRDEHAFLFYKKDDEVAECMFVPIIQEKAERAITCDANFGPTFGGGLLAWEEYDLQAFKKDRKPEYESKDGYLLLNGSMNVPCAYDVEGSFKKRFPFLRKEVNSDNNDLSPEKSNKSHAKTKNINSGTMLVKRIEVYQVLEDTLPKPWKTIKPENNDCNRMRETLEEMEPLPGLDIKYYNILMVGVIGAGKSSFYNTLAAAFSKKVVPYAPARKATTSVTHEINAYDIVSENGKRLKVRIVDIRGFEDERGYDHELTPLLEGKLKLRYQFPDKSLPLKNEHLQKATLNEEIHLVCFVTGVSNFGTITPYLRSQIESIKDTVAKRGLPMGVVATKFDKMCPKLDEDADHIYNCPQAAVAASMISDFFGVPITHVYPVLNYVNEQKDIGKDRLALQALHGMTILIQAYVQKHKGIAQKLDEWEEREKILPLLKHPNDKEIELMKLHNKLSELEDRKLRVLVVGPTKSGKSSFIDSISSTLRCEIVNQAAGGRMASGGPEGMSLTERFQMYSIKYKLESDHFQNSKVSFGDIPGFQERGGITAEHITYILKGHVPNKCEFQKGIEKNSSCFIHRPMKYKNIHCVCFVFDCKTVVKGLSDILTTTIDTVLNVLSKEGIPFIIILTKGDIDNQAVMTAKRSVFASIDVKTSKDKLMNIFRLKQNLFFPVVNYVHENEVDLQGDALLIAAFNEILKKGKEYLEESDDESGEEFHEGNKE